MATDTDDSIKHRDIRFHALHGTEEAPAHSAMLLLADAPGIINLHPLSKLGLHVSYDLQRVTLAMIETALIEVGFHLDNSLMCKLKRALYHYTEDTQCINMGYHPDSKTTRDIYICRYQRLQHGCRDERPSHWRKYL